MKKTYKVDQGFHLMRIDRWIRNKFGNVPQGLIEKNLRNGQIKLNQKKTKSSTKIKVFDEIDIFKFDFKENTNKKKNFFLPSRNIIKENEKLIIENNEDFLVVNKQPGIAVQGGTKSKKNLIDIFSKSQIFQNSKPYTVHRLDKDTSGVFIIAKNRETAQLLTSLFRLRKVYKTYLSICHGEIQKNEGIINDTLVRYEKDKKIFEKAKSVFKVLDKNASSSLVEMKPITGRKHQLRKHLFMMGNSILGDDKYNSQIKKKSVNKNLMLHSYEIKFKIKNTKHTYRASLPDYFKKMLKTKRLTFRD